MSLLVTPNAEYLSGLDDLSLRTQRPSPHRCHVRIHIENSLLFQDIAGYCMVITVLPLLCAQAGPESQVTLDGPGLCRRWSVLPTKSVKLLIDQAFSCLLSFSRLPLWMSRWNVRRFLGQELGIKLNCPQFGSAIL